MWFFCIPLTWIIVSKRQCDMEQQTHPVTPERAVEILKKHNVIITLEQAQKIIEFMERFAKLAIEQYVNEL